MEKITSTNVTFVGFGYFFQRPHLWVAPLFAALFSFIILIVVFVLTTYFSWPEGTTNWLSYTWGVFKSFGYASLTIIILWVSVFPIILNFAFENMIGKILHDKQVPIKGEGTFQAAVSTVQVLFRTLGWRLFWPLVTLIALFFFGPLAIFLAQVGMGHIAFIDAADLSLMIQGQPARERIGGLKARTMPLLTAGFIAGILSMVLTTTIIGWLFWLPSVYAGAALWTQSWSSSDF
ncbi:hypothetical protein [Candidatus Neptunochlamydia vexilliferae]|uniref:Uncharacterized protein n=1 Tax=Candidatus Neptunichlamydia vexilliferae TaxID=1651774 RepID=A0ABS0AYJ7_9BACT|nr:hypothetical protein [Candidatus Neptunochlamydia vexilliferae]MBF5059222.1 hypothetical protein [Candidatus Neptunochlamydia vexilliferae]